MTDPANPGNTTNTTTSTTTKPGKPEPDTLPPYKVLLHNDDVNYIGDVVLAIAQLVKVTTERAAAHANEAQQSGVSLLLVTHKERAELYQQQFMSKNLTVTIEPDEA